ncbi:MAG: dihydroorotase [Verrucomicrobiales bacterium]|jgi:dihydroorotase|nr:dihydroorotase [Verrucomicrobiales bacterium]
MGRAFLFKGGRVINPADGEDAVRDLLVEDGYIVAEFSADAAVEHVVVNVGGQVVAPGLIDIHVHLREPGQTAKETIASGSRAAAAGGFTSVVAMPNTTPPVDNTATVGWLLQRARETAVVNVFPTGCISQGQAGELLAPIGSLKKAGVVAITDDGRCIQNNELMRRALEYARMFDLVVMDHCQDYALTAGGVMHEGYWSTVLGLKGWPALGEELVIARDVLLAELTGCRVHCQHVTTAGGARLLREAKRRGVNISGEVCAHHLALTDAALQGYDANFKMNPPLRTARDIEALLAGVADGTLEYLASDHAPHANYEKEVEFADAPFGIVGLETEFAIFNTKLVQTGVRTLPQVIESLTVRPARLLGLPKGTLAVGAVADVTVLDPGARWTVDRDKFQSKSRNTPFHGTEWTGRATLTMVGGKIVWTLADGILV